MTIETVTSKEGANLVVLLLSSLCMVSFKTVDCIHANDNA